MYVCMYLFTLLSLSFTLGTWPVQTICACSLSLLMSLFLSLPLCHLFTRLDNVLLLSTRLGPRDKREGREKKREGKKDKVRHREKGGLFLSLFKDSWQL